MEKTTDKFYLQLDNFCRKIDGYATTLGITTADSDPIKGDRDFLHYLLLTKKAYKDYGQNWTKYVDLAIFGHKNEVLGTLPPLPVLATAPTPTAENMQKRFSNIISKCKSSNNFTTAIGTDLDIMVNPTVFDPTQGKPILKVVLNAGYPEISYSRNKFHGIAIYKDSGSGYVKLERIHETHYIDHSALPAHGAAQVWKYKAIYLYHDAETATMSDEVSITVMGQ